MWKKSIIFSLVIIIGLSTTLSPKGTYAFSKSDIIVLDDDHTSTFDLILQTEDEIIYEVQEDDELFRYEEEIIESENKTEIQTNIYIMGSNGLFELYDSYLTEYVTDDNQNFKITSDGETFHLFLPTNNNNVIIPPEKFIPLPGNPTVETMAYSSWTKSYFPNLNLGYRRDYSRGLGEASFSSIKKIDINIKANKVWDTYVAGVNSLRAWEQALVFDATIIGAIQAMLKFKNKPSFANLLKIGRKFAVPIGTLYNCFQWILAYDKATTSFAKLGGTRIKN